MKNQMDKNMRAKRRHHSEFRVYKGFYPPITENRMEQCYIELAYGLYYRDSTPIKKNRVENEPEA